MTQNYKMDEVDFIECRFVTHLTSGRPGDTDDLHLIKEMVHLKSGDSFPSVRQLVNYKRPYWLTTPANRNHNEKKEWEKRSRVKEFTSTQSQLANEVGRKLRMPPPKNGRPLRLSHVNKSPYVYGTDVTAATIIKQRYADQFPDRFTKYKIAALDFETDMSTEEELPIMGIFSMKDKAHLTVIEKLIAHIPNAEEKFWDACERMQVTDGLTVREHLEERDLWKKVNFDIVKDNLGVVTNLLESAHQWSPDFVSIWNMDFDVGKMMQTFKAYNVNPAHYLSDPRIEARFQYANYIPGKAYKKKADGSESPVPPVDRWNTLNSAASWYVVCAMCSYKKLRPTEPKMKYALDVAAKKHIKSIIDIFVKGEVEPRLTREKIKAKEYFHRKDYEKGNFKKPITFPEKIKGDVVTKDGVVVLRKEELKSICNRYGDKASSEVGKLKFAPADGKIGRDWHVFMQKHFPIEYAVYCLWDGVVLEKLDEVTNDLSTTLPVLCGPTEIPRFTSGPKKLCDNMHFFVQDYDCVVGSTSDDMTTEFCKYLQSLNDWITLLEPHTVHDDIGIPAIKGLPMLKTKGSIAAFDIDVKSAYPNSGDALNMAKATTEKEFCRIEHLSREDQRQIGLNMSAAMTNSVELCRVIYRAPSMIEVLMTLKEQGKVKLKNPELV